MLPLGDSRSNQMKSVGSKDGRDKRRTVWKVCLFYLCFIGSGCASTAVSLPSAGVMPIPAVAVATAPSIPVHTRQDIYHEVGPLESVWRISKMYDVTQDAIIEANQLKNPSQIEIGQVLFVPNAAAQRAVIPLYHTRPWSHMVVHHTATETGNARTIHNSHHERGFISGMGYHFLIDNGSFRKADGQIEVGPRWLKQMNGAHCNANGMNERGIGIALVGNFSESQPSHEQMESLVFLVNMLKKHYGITQERIVRHGSVPGKNTECPGLLFPWQEFKNRLN
jgi:N-acetylmuramoyl-L-alanine amidase